MGVEMGWDVGSVGGSDTGRTFTFTSFYMFAPVELTKKKDCAGLATGVRTQLPGNDATAVSRSIAAQALASYTSAFIHISHPLGSLCFPSTPWQRLCRACKKPSSHMEAGEKIPERNLGTDLKSDCSIICGSQWQMVIPGTAADLPPNSAVPGLLHAPQT